MVFGNFVVNDIPLGIAADGETKCKRWLMKEYCAYFNSFEIFFGACAI